MGPRACLDGRKISAPHIYIYIYTYIYTYIYVYTCIYTYIYIIYALRACKGKATPLQPSTVPEGSRRFRLSDFKTIDT